MALVPFISTVVLGWAAAERGGWDPFPTQAQADQAFVLVERFIDGLVGGRQRKARPTAEGDPANGGHSASLRDRAEAEPAPGIRSGSIA